MLDRPACMTRSGGLASSSGHAPMVGSSRLPALPRGSAQLLLGRAAAPHAASRASALPLNARLQTTCNAAADPSARRGRRRAAAPRASSAESESRWHGHGAHNGGGPSTTATASTASAAPATTASSSSISSSGVAAGDADVLIEFHDVYKAFGDKPILQGASFQIRRGEAVGIIGASGTGKSTTLRIAAGLLAPDSGEVSIMGHRRTGLLSDQTDDEHLRVGMVFQNAALFDSLTVGENVGFLLYEHSQLPPENIERIVEDSLSKVGLRGVQKLFPNELSGGMKKRVALARAVVCDENDDSERVIMYDEPTAGLDPVASTVVEDLMRSLHYDSLSASMATLDPSYESDTEGHHGHHHHHHGAANGGGNGAAPPPPPLPLPRITGRLSGISSYVVVTHQHSTIRRAVDRLIFLHEGKVAWQGTVEEYDTTDEPVVAQFRAGSLNGPIAYL